MPRIPLYQSGQVGPVETTGARFRAPDMARSGFAEGLQGFGQALGQYADVQDRIIAQSEDTQARAGALPARAELNETLASYGTLQGGNAVDAQAATLEKLKAIKDKHAGQMTSPRMKAFFDRYFNESYADAVGRVNGHALQQVQVQRKSTLSAEVESFGQSAVANWEDIAGRDKDIAAGKASIAELGQMQGMGEQAITLEQRKFVSGIHRNTLDSFMASADPDIKAAVTYFNAHHDEMLAGDVEAVMKDLKGPLQDRQADSDFVRATGGGVVASATAPGVGTSLSRMASITAQSESGNRERQGDGSLVTSPKGAQGAMQVMPGTQRDPGFGVTPMRDNSDAERTRVGRDYLGKMMERYGNDPAKAWAAYNWGPGNLDKAIEQHGSGWLAHAPAETREYVNRNMAELDGSGHSTETPREWDKDAAYNKIDALADKEGWTWERRERAKRRADQLIARDEQLLDRQYHAAAQDAVQVIAGLGDNFTDISQIPSAIRNRANPTDVAQWAEAARKNKKAITDEAVRKEQDDTALRATLRMYNDQAGFMAADIPKEYLSKVSSSAFAQLVTAQARMRQDASKPQAWEPFSESNQALNTYLTLNPPKNGKLSDEEKASALKTINDVATDFVQRTGKPPTSSDMYEIAGRSMRRVQVPGTLWGTNDVSLYNVKSVPKADHDSIAATFKRVYKRDPSEDEVLQWYRRQLAGDLR